MNEFLKRLKLIDSFQVELAIDKSDFVQILKANLDDPVYGVFDVFSEGKHGYRDKVKNDAFDLTRSRSVDLKVTSTEITGTLTQAGNKLVIDVVLNALHKMMIPFYILMVIIYIIMLSLFASEMEIVILIVLVHAIYVFGGAYRAMKRSLRATRHDFERDLYFITKDHVNPSIQHA